MTVTVGLIYDSFIRSYRNRFTWHLVLSELQGQVTMSKNVKDR